MNIKLFTRGPVLGRSAAATADRYLGEVISKRGSARIIAATGASQLSFLQSLTQSARIDWSAIEVDPKNWATS